MIYRKRLTQELAAAKVGLSERTARRIERGATLPSQKPRRYWRSRSDPFAEVWETAIAEWPASTAGEGAGWDVPCPQPPASATRRSPARIDFGDLIGTVSPKASHGR